MYDKDFFSHNFIFLIFLKILIHIFKFSKHINGDHCIMTRTIFYHNKDVFIHLFHEHVNKTFYKYYKMASHGIFNILSIAILKIASY